MGAAAKTLREISRDCTGTFYNLSQKKEPE
jgi:hypothetical protein